MCDLFNIFYSIVSIWILFRFMEQLTALSIQSRSNFATIFLKPSPPNSNKKLASGSFLDN